MYHVTCFPYSYFLEFFAHKFCTSIDVAKLDNCSCNTEVHSRSVLHQVLHMFHTAGNVRLLHATIRS